MTYRPRCRQIRCLRQGHTSGEYVRLQADGQRKRADRRTLERGTRRVENTCEGRACKECTSALSAHKRRAHDEDENRPTIARTVLARPAQADKVESACDGGHDGMRFVSNGGVFDVEPHLLLCEQFERQQLLDASGRRAGTRTLPALAQPLHSPCVTLKSVKRVAHSLARAKACLRFLRHRALQRQSGFHFCTLPRRAPPCCCPLERIDVAYRWLSRRSVS